jgi:hypothetical protein
MTATIRDRWRTTRHRLGHFRRQLLASVGIAAPRARRGVVPQFESCLPRYAGDDREQDFVPLFDLAVWRSVARLSPRGSLRPEGPARQLTIA